jgi:hypothetical protein
MDMYDGTIVKLNGLNIESRSIIEPVQEGDGVEESGEFGEEAAALVGAIKVMTRGISHLNIVTMSQLVYLDYPM